MNVIKIHPQNSRHLSFTLHCLKTVCGVCAGVRAFTYCVLSIPCFVAVAVQTLTVLSRSAAILVLWSHDTLFCATCLMVSVWPVLC